MKIAGVASAFPKHRYPQEVLTQALISHWGDKLAKPRLLERFHENSAVETRYLTLPMEEYVHIEHWGQANSAWIKAAQDLGEQAINAALRRAGIDKKDLSAIFCVSVTGIASPTLDARLVNRMGLSLNIKRIPIFGLGCVAGAAGIARAADYVRAFPDQAAVLLSVELCSLTLQRDDFSMANMVSSGLFGDGAAAVIVTGTDRKADGPEILATRSVFYPDTEQVMGWDISEKGFRIVLSPEVPTMVTRHLAKDVDAFLNDMGYRRQNIGRWILHTGGPHVLEATAEALGLLSSAFDVSWECLRQYGNLSSASVLVVLEEVMTHRRPEPGTLSLLAAMGPGFCSELVLLRW
jgi:alkylresorcinol/alkylpyrone synthase